MHERIAWIKAHGADAQYRDDRCWYKHSQWMPTRVLPGHTVCRYHLEMLRDSDSISAGAYEGEELDRTTYPRIATSAVT